jgi:hypothetical protein
MGYFKKGMPRPPNAGRKKGSKNKKKILRVEEVLLESNFHPIQHILNLLPELTPSEQTATCLKLIKYLQPELKAQEVDPNTFNSDSDSEETEATDNLTNADLIALVQSKKSI